jgi:carbon storage regulator
MLILTRRIGEKLMIGEDLILSIMGVQGSRVRVGVSARSESADCREEIYDCIKQLNQRAEIVAALKSDDVSRRQ